MSFNQVTSAAVQTDRGYEAFTAFHNAALQFPANYNLSLDGVRSEILKKSPSFFQMLGKTVINSGLPMQTVKERLANLAVQNRGLLPTQLSRFLAAVDPVNIDKAEWSWTSQGWRAVKDGIGDGLQELGDAASNATFTTLGLLPFALAGGILLFAYVKAKA